jgi:NitT/TauT family transport system substrate-binding protein
MRSRSLVLVCVPAVSALLLAGCVSGGSAPDPTDGTTLELRVGIPVTANALSAYVAEEEGLFAAQNIEVEFVPVQSGAEAIPMLLNNQIDVTLGDGFGTITAAANGLPLAVFGVATIQPTDLSLDPAIIVTKDASVTVEDLADQKFAVSALGGYHELSSKSTIDTLGGDSSRVQYVELTPATMADAVENGQVAAALITEPYTTQAEQRGLHLLAAQAVGTQGVSGTLWVATQQAAAEHPDTLAAFAAAVEEAGHVVNEDPGLARTVAKTYMTVEPEVIDVMRFPTFTDRLSDTSGLDALVDLAVKYEMLDETPNMDQLVVTAGG